MNFATVKKNYDRGLWNLAMVRMAVRKSIITKDQYKEITGKDYNPADSSEKPVNI